MSRVCRMTTTRSWSRGQWEHVTVHFISRRLIPRSEHDDMSHVMKRSRA